MSSFCSHYRSTSGSGCRRHCHSGMFFAFVAGPTRRRMLQDTLLPQGPPDDAHQCDLVKQRETKADQQAACKVHGTASPLISTAYAGLSWHAAFANRVQIHMAVAVCSGVPSMTYPTPCTLAVELGVPGCAHLLCHQPCSLLLHKCSRQLQRTAVDGMRSCGSFSVKDFVSNECKSSVELHVVCRQLHARASA
jgi:hypothetical protein